MRHGRSGAPASSTLSRMDRAEPEGWERGRGSARAGCSWTITLRWRLRLAMARGTNGAALARAEGEHGGISSCRAGSVADCCAVRDGEELEHVPRGLASGANVKPAADRRRRGREPRVDWLCTFNRRKWWEKPNVIFTPRRAPRAAPQPLDARERGGPQPLRARRAPRARFGVCARGRS